MPFSTSLDVTMWFSFVTDSRVFARPTPSCRLSRIAALVPSATRKSFATPWPYDPAPWTTTIPFRT
eukprot:31032-Pelagococcus_subviridis.AAC.6